MLHPARAFYPVFSLAALQLEDNFPPHVYPVPNRVFTRGHRHQVEVCTEQKGGSRVWKSEFRQEGFGEVSGTNNGKGEEIISSIAHNILIIICHVRSND